jgi:hypothetical protein
MDGDANSVWLTLRNSRRAEDCASYGLRGNIGKNLMSLATLG